MSDARKVCGLVGSGPWVELIQARVLAAHPGLTFDRIWARNTAAAERIADRYGLQVCASHAELVESAEVVSYSVPPAAQAELAVEARRAGRAVLLEKPVAATRETALELRDAGAGAVAVHYSRLLNPGLQGWLLDRPAEQWRDAQIVITNDALLGDSPFAASPWRREPNASVWDLGSHALSVSLAVLGPATSVRSTERNGAVQARLTHRSGTESGFVCSLTSPEPTEDYRFTDRDGTASAPRFAFDPEASLARAIDVLLQGPANPLDVAATDLDFSAHVVAVLEVVIESLRTGGAGVLPLRGGS